MPRLASTWFGRGMSLSESCAHIGPESCRIDYERSLYFGEDIEGIDKGVATQQQVDPWRLYVMAGGEGLDGPGRL
jgi:hypothetical protein